MFLFDRSLCRPSDRSLERPVESVVLLSLLLETLPCSACQNGLAALWDKDDEPVYPIWHWVFWGALLNEAVIRATQNHYSHRANLSTKGLRRGAGSGSEMFCALLMMVFAFCEQSCIRHICERAAAYHCAGRGRLSFNLAHRPFDGC